jgi:cytochrome c oxidase subunit 2
MAVALGGRLFLSGFSTHVGRLVAPGQAYVVRAVAQAGGWEFIHPDDVTSRDLALPAGAEVKLVATSRDHPRVLRVPALGLRLEVVPGGYATAWCRVLAPGEYRATTTGRRGEDDRVVTVLSLGASDLTAWLDRTAAASGVEPVVLGQRLFAAQGCGACHSTDGSARVGPSLLGLSQRDVRWVDGTAGRADAAYLRDSILSPSAKVVEGFPPVMPSFRGRMRDAQVDALVGYLSGL